MAIWRWKLTKFWYIQGSHTPWNDNIKKVRTECDGKFPTLSIDTKYVIFWTCFCHAELKKQHFFGFRQKKDFSFKNNVYSFFWIIKPSSLYTLSLKFEKFDCRKALEKEESCVTLMFKLFLAESAGKRFNALIMIEVHLLLAWKIWNELLPKLNLIPNH